jgi:hypothetical protein
MNELARMDNNSSEINLLINEFEKTIAQVIQVMALLFMQCCVSGMFIPDPNFSVSNPGSEFFSSRIHIKEFKYCNSKNGFKALGNMIRVVHPGYRIRILDPDPDFLPIPDPGCRGQKGKDPGSLSATLYSWVKCTKIGSRNLRYSWAVCV